MKASCRHATILLNDAGSTLIVAALILIAVSILAIALVKGTKTEINIAGNYRDIIRDFYLAESSNQLEITRISNDLNVNDITKRNILYDGNATKRISDESPSKSTIFYHNYESANNMPGYSSGSFNKYYFIVETKYPLPVLNREISAVNTLSYKIGPKLEQ